MLVILFEFILKI